MCIFYVDYLWLLNVLLVKIIKLIKNDFINSELLKSILAEDRKKYTHDTSNTNFYVAY